MYADYLNLLPDGKLEPVKAVAPEPALYRDDNHVGLCVMIRRRVLEAGWRYDLKTRVAEDLDFFVQAFDQGFRVARFGGEPLLWVRRHDAAGSVMRFTMQALETARILSRREWSLLKRSRIYSYWYSDACYHHREKKDWNPAVSVALTGLYRAPFSCRLWWQLIASVLRIPPR